jgi:hypothetical protein
LKLHAWKSGKIKSTHSYFFMLNLDAGCGHARGLAIICSVMVGTDSGQKSPYLSEDCQKDPNQVTDFDAATKGQFGQWAPPNHDVAENV